MKKLSFAIIFACIAMASMAQDAIRVNYHGKKPTISDFAWAFVTALDEDEDECGDEPTNAILEALTRYRAGQPQEDGVTLTVDEKNGYLLYEFGYDTVDVKMEMCYWNETDGKHKLFAFNNMSTFVGGRLTMTETSGLIFYRYNNATKKMTYCAPPGFEVDYDCSYALPRSGKNIIVTRWDDIVPVSERTLKWNGHNFSF